MTYETLNDAMTAMRRERDRMHKSLAALHDAHDEFNRRLDEALRIARGGKLT